MGAYIVYLLVIGAGLYFLSRLFRRETFPFRPKETLLSESELDFFHVLECVIPDNTMIAPKVRLGDVIGCSESDWQAGHGPRISAKHLDFVLIERGSSHILAGIELDDRSHDRPDRRDRDIFIEKAMAAAQVPLLRVKVARSYSQTELKKALDEILS
jgi:hypothetical protein